MMPPSSSRTDFPASEEILGAYAGGQLAQAGLAILSELESSLGRSQKALLALDGAAVERLNEEQTRLGRAWEICFLPQTPSSQAPPWPELRAAASRVAQLARVQAVLVRRAQRLCTLLSNFKADPGEIYSPTPFDNAGFRSAGPEWGG